MLKLEEKEIEKGREKKSQKLIEIGYVVLGSTRSWKKQKQKTVFPLVTGISEIQVPSGPKVPR